MTILLKSEKMAELGKKINALTGLGTNAFLPRLMEKEAKNT